MKLDVEARIVRTEGSVDDVCRFLENLFGTTDQGDPGRWVVTDATGDYRPEASDVHLHIRHDSEVRFGYSVMLPESTVHLMVRPNLIVLGAVSGDLLPYRAPTKDEMRMVMGWLEGGVQEELPFEFGRVA